MENDSWKTGITKVTELLWGNKGHKKTITYMKNITVHLRHEHVAILDNS